LKKEAKTSINLMRARPISVSSLAPFASGRFDAMTARERIA